jgi:molybdopterin synthase sulfur carrier subunit
VIGGTMRITVKLFATLRAGRFALEAIDLDGPRTVTEIIDRIGIPQKEVTLMFVNGRHVSRDFPLSDGDVLALFPPVGGG